MTNKEVEEKVMELQKSVGGGLDMDEVELLDVVNNEDEVVGILSRSVVWENGLQHNVRCVDVFLVNEYKEILLQTRSLKKKYWPGGYDYSCGESLKSGETYEEAIKRGLYEELGVTVLGGDIEEKGKYKLDEAKGFACFGKVYLVKTHKDQKFVFNTEETSELNWKTVDYIRDLNNLYPDKFKGGFRAVFDMVFGE